MRKFLAIFSIALGFFMALLDTTIVNITLPKMTDYFGTDVKTISWVLNGYNLAFAVILITASRLADQFGRKKMYLAGVIAFTVASCLSGISTSVTMLITFRVIQGIAAAMLVPVTMPMSLEMIAEDKRGPLNAFWGAFSALAATSGPALGGVLSENFNWQSIFYINIPIGILAVALCIPLVTESYDPTATKRIDWLGMITLSISMFCVTLALIQVNDYGWSSSYIITLFVTCLLSFILFLFIENRVNAPLVPLWIMRIIPFSAGAMSFFMVGIGLMSGVFLLVFYLTNVVGLSEFHAGLIVTAMPLTALPASGISANLAEKIGSRIFTIIGMTALAIFIYLCSGLDPNATSFDIIWRLMVGGFGLGFTMAPLMGATFRSVPHDKSGVASGITNMTRTLGQVLGVAMLITLLNAHLTTEVDNAKVQAITMVKADQTINDQVKEKFIENLQNPNSSAANQMPSLAEILKQLDQQKTKVLQNASATVRTQIEKQFGDQEQALNTIYPQIQNIFRTTIVIEHRSVEEAKAKAILLIKNNKDLNDQVKNSMISNLSHSNSPTNMPKLEDLISKLKQQQQKIVNDATAAAQANINDQFAKSKQAIQTLYPQIQTVMKSHVSSAFSWTFKIGSLIMLLGLVFGVFSDPGKKTYSKSANQHAAIIH